MDNFYDFSLIAKLYLELQLCQLIEKYGIKKGNGEYGLTVRPLNLLNQYGDRIDYIWYDPVYANSLRSEADISNNYTRYEFIKNAYNTEKIADLLDRLTEAFAH